MKRSAGVLPYKIIDGDIMFYLERPGGPFWKGKDKWSICKGEYSAEKAIEAAIREFFEETGVKLKQEELFYIGSEKQFASNKLITVFGTNRDIDPSKMVSNTFKKEWPPNSGNIQEFPEMEEGKWFTYSEAMEKIFSGQKKILNKLYNKYRNGYLN